MATYEEAGVSLVDADHHVSNIGETVKSTWDENVIGAFGGFAAGVTIPSGYPDPVLMMSTDGVGTKLELARLTGLWSGVGQDLVAMCVDDLAVLGAKPIGFVDYIAVGRLKPDRDKEIVASVAEACMLAGCPLLGGETAEHPGVMEPDAVDLAGTAVGIVNRGEELSPSNARAGDLIVGLMSPNLRSNGFSLVRKVLGEELNDLAPRLLQPSIIYAPAVLTAIATGAVRSSAHITGGGIASNLRRALPDGLGAVVDTTSWEAPEVFAIIAEHGVSRAEMFNVFNMGVGFALVVAAEAVDSVLDVSRLHDARVIGEVSNRPDVRVS